MRIIFMIFLTFFVSLASTAISEQSKIHDKILGEEVYTCSTQLNGHLVLTYLHLDTEPRLIFRSPFFGTKAGEPLNTREVVKLKPIESSGSRRTYFAEYDQASLIIIMKIFGEKNDTIDMQINLVLDEANRDRSIETTGQAFCEKYAVSYEVIKSLISISEFGADGAQTATFVLPLTENEKEAFQDAVQNCWSYKKGSFDPNVKIVVAIELTSDGKVNISSVNLIGYEGGILKEAMKVFTAARRAISRCQKSGYDLPASKYDQWKNIEIIFDSHGVRKS